jgi:hypothetical protein
VKAETPETANGCLVVFDIDPKNRADNWGAKGTSIAEPMARRSDVRGISIYPLTLLIMDASSFLLAMTTCRS